MTETPDEIRLRIAKAKGWTDPTQLGQVFVYYSPDGRMCASLPNWPVSVQDAYDLESELTDPHEIHEYCRALNRILNRADKESDYAITASGNDFRWCLIHATPLQRCQAWLIVKDGDQ